MVATRRSGKTEQVAAFNAPVDDPSTSQPAASRPTRASSRTAAASAAPAAEAPATAETSASLIFEAIQEHAPASVQQADDTPASAAADGAVSGQATAPLSSRSKRKKSAEQTSAAVHPVALSDTAANNTGDDHGLGSDADEGKQQQLDAFSSLPHLIAALSTLQQQAGDGVAFLQPSLQLSDAARQTAKALYRYAVRHLLAGSAKAERAALKRGEGSGMALLPELHVDAFDAEQVWVQLDTANGAALRRVRRLVRKTGTGGLEEPAVQLVKSEYVESIDVMLRAADGQSSSSEDDEQEEEEEDDDDDDLAAVGSSEEGDFEDALDQHLGSDTDEDEDDDDDEEGGFLTGSKSKGTKRGRGKDSKKAGKGSKKAKYSREEQDEEGDLLPVEDRFMRLGEMEKFMLDAEARRAAGDEEDVDEDEDEEDDNDALYGAGSDAEDDEEMAGLLRDTARLAGRADDGAGDAAKTGKQHKAFSGADAMYEDFFGSRGSAGQGRKGSQPAAAAGGGRGTGRGDVDEMDQLDDDEDGDGLGDNNKKRRVQLDEDMEGEDEESEDEDEEMGKDSEDGEAADMEDADSEDGEDLQRLESRKGTKGQGKGADPLAGLSTHERRLARMQERIAGLEAGAMGPKDWTMVGEVAGGKRPLNSALEVDLDFETSVKPPPAPTEEVMADLESLIKRRIAEQRFDDVVRVVPPPTERTKRAVELDDAKSSKGLGELYEEQYVRATVGGAAEDRDEKTRAEARALFKALVVKLDALTHFHFAPKPVVEEVSIKSDVAALAMEEAAPVGVSKAGMQTATEVFAPAAHGKPTAEGELSREERKRRRANKKRARKGETKQKEAEKKSRAVAAGGTAEVIGRKSASNQVAANKAVKQAAGAGQKRSTGRSEFGKSTAVFARMQEAQDQAKAGIKPASVKAAKADKAPRDAASFKL